MISGGLGDDKINQSADVKYWLSGYLHDVKEVTQNIILFSFLRSMLLVEESHIPC